MPWTPKQLEKIHKEDITDLTKTSGFNDWIPSPNGYHSQQFGDLAVKYGFPDTWVAGGGGVGMFYFVGFWCGKDNDLICIAPLPLQKTEELDPYLSPEGRTPLGAIRKVTARRHLTLQ